MMLYRVIAIVGGALALAACTSTSDFGSFGDLGKMDIFKTGPVMDTVSFESEPPGAEAKLSNGQSCRTPCSLALPTEQPLTVTYTLAGYETQVQQLEVISVPGETPHLRPNPVVAELAAAPPPKPVKKTAPRKPAAKKPAAKKPAPKPTAAAPPPAPAATAPAQVPTFAPPPPPAASSPWPAPPPKQ
jgi:hypothetical protein